MTISFTKTNLSNSEIKYFEFNFPMIKKNTKETLNKFPFQRRKNLENLRVSKRYQTIENTTNKQMRMIAMKNLNSIWLAKGATQSLRGDNALQCTPEWETVHCSALCLDQQCVGRSRDSKFKLKNTLLMQLFDSKV